MAGYLCPRCFAEMPDKCVCCRADNITAAEYDAYQSERAMRRLLTPQLLPRLSAGKPELIIPLQGGGCVRLPVDKGWLLEVISVAVGHLRGM